MAAPPTFQATISRCPQPYRPHQAAPSSHPPATAPKASPHTPTRKYGGGGGRGVSITPTPPTAPPPMRAHPTHATPATTAHPTATRTRAARHPLQAPKTCATRTPPPGATGAHLSALQPTPKPSTHPRQTSRQRPAHTRTAAPPRPSPPTVTPPADTTHPSQPQPPRPRSTNTRGHELNRRSLSNTQRSDQHKRTSTPNQLTTNRNHFPQAPQGIPRGATDPDRCASYARTS